MWFRVTNSVDPLGITCGQPALLAHNAWLAAQELVVRAARVHRLEVTTSAV
jgi:hypothetical protein